jgi:NAD dependent epimerase/dehydratase family enzyme
MGERQIIVLAGGTGDLGRYLHDELTKDGQFSVVLLTRKVYSTLLLSYLDRLLAI